MSTLQFRSSVYKPNGVPKAVIFFVVSFKTRSWLYQPVFQVLTRAGFLVHSYDYDSRPLLSALPEEWVDFSTEVVDDIKTSITDYQRDNQQLRFGIIGVSVGSVITMHAAKCIKALERIMLVTVYGSSAQQVWEHPSLEHLKQTFEQRHQGVKQAYHVFEHLEPTHQLEKIAHRPVLVFGNEQDPVIRFSNTKILLDRARELKLDLAFIPIESAKHSLTIVKAFRMTHIWVNFFKPLVGQLAVQETHMRSSIIKPPSPVRSPYASQPNL